MGPDLTLFVDTSRRVFVQSASTMQGVRLLDLIQGSNLQCQAQFLTPSGNGLAPYGYLDPTSWTVSLGLGYIDTAGTPHLIALAPPTAFTITTALSGVTGQTALAFNLNLGTPEIQTLLAGVNSAPVWCEMEWFASTATTAFSSKAQMPCTVRTGYLGVGLANP